MKYGIESRSRDTHAEVASFKRRASGGRLGLLLATHGDLPQEHQGAAPHCRRYRHLRIVEWARPVLHRLGTVAQAQTVDFLTVVRYSCNPNPRRTNVLIRSVRFYERVLNG